MLRKNVNEHAQLQHVKQAGLRRKINNSITISLKHISNTTKVFSKLLQLQLQLVNGTRQKKRLWRNESDSEVAQLGLVECKQ